MRVYKKILVGATLLLATSFLACKKIDSYNEPVSKDKTKPGVVSNIKVDNFDGGAFITYDLPNSANILYVRANYRINETTTRETKSSYYSDTVKVSGFARSKEYEVTLRVVTRANVESDPVTVKVNPRVPVYQQVFPSLKMQSDFGGAYIQASNPLKSPIGIVVVDFTLAKPTLIKQYYTNQENINFNVRGFNTQERKFGAFITDEWGNVSDTLIKTINPVFEEEINKSKFRALTIPFTSDNSIYKDWGLERLWDNKLEGAPPFHTTIDRKEKIPASCTFDMGQVAKLSRYKAWQQAQYAYDDGNPKKWVLWGSDKLGEDIKLPENSMPGDVVGGWVQMGTYNSPPPPSGIVPPAPVAQSDKEFVKPGFEFNVPFDAPPVRYIRIQALELWNPTINFFIFHELTFYGKTQ